MRSHVIVHVTQKVIKPDYAALDKFSKKDLAEYAKSIGVEVGKDKNDTILNLLRSKRVAMLAQLGN